MFVISVVPPEQSPPFEEAPPAYDSVGRVEASPHHAAAPAVSFGFAPAVEIEQGHDESGVLESSLDQSEECTSQENTLEDEVSTLCKSNGCYIFISQPSFSNSS